MDMRAQYDAKATETKWYDEWVERGYFHAEPSDREPYCIVLPPPNVTGALHAGHAFQQSLQDFVIRRKRMQGYEALWLPGTDHAGIATQVVVERELAKEGIERREMGRDAFLERVWAWKEQYGGRIVEKMLGDTGVAVHPDDQRYRALVGRTVTHPFTGADLPIVADPAVDPDFGTGAVKVTPAHDPTDFEIAERTGLPAINILNADATLADTVPEEFRGLDRYGAREAVRGRPEATGRIVDEVRPYPHPVGHCYRCHSEIEPWLSGEQWFVAVDRLKT